MEADPGSPGAAGARIDLHIGVVGVGLAGEQRLDLGLGHLGLGDWSDFSASVTIDWSPSILAQLDQLGAVEESTVRDRGSC